MADSRDYRDLPGGDASVGTGQSGRKGVFSNHPAMSPKYNTSNNEKSLDSMARLFVSFTSARYRRWMKSFDRDDRKSGVSTLAKSIAVTDTSAARSEDQGAGFGTGYIDFLLQSAQESLQEKFQVVDVLSDNYVSYFFGQQPPVFSYSGVLLNSLQDDWRIRMHQLYQLILRGTKLARQRVVVSLAYDDVIVTGAMINLSQTLNAQNELAVPFSFQLLVKRFDVHAAGNASSTFGTPTLLNNYPYRLTPSSFVSKSNVRVTSTIYNASEAKFTTIKRAKEGAEEKKEKDLSGITPKVGTDAEEVANAQYNSGATNTPVQETTSGDEFTDLVNEQAGGSQ